MGKPISGQSQRIQVYITNGKRYHIGLWKMLIEIRSNG